MLALKERVSQVSRQKTLGFIIQHGIVFDTLRAPYHFLKHLEYWRKN